MIFSPFFKLVCDPNILRQIPLEKESVCPVLSELVIRHGQGRGRYTVKLEDIRLTTDGGGSQ